MCARKVRSKSGLPTMVTRRACGLQRAVNVERAGLTWRRGPDLVFPGIWAQSSRRLSRMHDHRASHAGAGGCGRSSAIIRKISWNICRGMATSAVWKATLRADLDQLLLRARQRPVLDRLGRRQRAQEIAEIVGERKSRRCPRTSCMTGAFSGSIQTHGSVPFASRSIRSAMTRSARCRPARKIQSVSPTRSDDRALSQFEVERRLDQSPRNLELSSASCASSAVGRPQCPSSIASASPSSRRRACDQGAQGSRV